MAYQSFNPETDIVENQRTTISSGLWTGGSSTLTSFFTQSTNGNITGSFLELYNEDPNQSSSAETQFAIGYAHVHGSGSKGNVSKLTTGGRQSAALYRQFRNLILAPNTSEFTFTGHSGTSEDFYFISFQRAKVNSEEIKYINAHGTSTPLNDKFETMSIKTVFGNDTKIPISSTKSMTGHLLGAAGAIESIFSICSINNNIVPPTINLNSPDNEANLHLVANQSEERNIKSVMNNTLCVNLSRVFRANNNF